MKRSFITVLIFLACLFRGFCQEYEYKVFESSEGEKLNYRLLTLKKSGAKVEYFEFPGCGHGSWNPAFNQPDFFNWLFKQKR